MMVDEILTAKTMTDGGDSLNIFCGGDGHIHSAILSSTNGWFNFVGSTTFSGVDLGRSTYEENKNGR